MTSVIKVATMKDTDNFCYKRKSSCATAKFTLVTANKDEWYTKEDTGKFIKNQILTLSYCPVFLGFRVTKITVFESIWDQPESLFLGLVLPNQYCPIIVWEN